MNVENIVDVKQKNVKKIIDYLRFKDIITKKEIAQALELSFATVSNICNELKEKKIIQEDEMQDTRSVGRAPKAISINYKENYILCLDLHVKNSIKIALINFGNEIVKEKYDYYEDGISIYDFVEKCFEQFQKHIIASDILNKQIIGFGIAVPGIFDKATENVIASEIELFENQPLKKMLTNRFKMPVYVDNESNLCAVYTQHYQQNGTRENNAIYLYSGEGLGIGVVSQGQLLRGERGYAPEICHIPIGKSKYKCELCNNYECIQTDLSILGFTTKYFEEEVYNKEKMQEKWAKFVDKVKQKDEKALKVISENGIIMGRLISILINLFDPNVVYIGGEISLLFEELLPIIKPEVDKRLVVNKNSNIEIKVDHKSNHTILLGAAEMVFDKWNPQI